VVAAEPEEVTAELADVNAVAKDIVNA